MRAGQRVFVSLILSAVACGGLLAQLIDRTKEAEPIDRVIKDLSLEKRADIYMARKMYREAGETYRDALSSDPNSARLINKLGISYHQLMLLGNARKEYERAWKLDNNYSQAMNNLGTVYHAQGRYRKAIRSYKKALQSSPYSASIYSNLGTSYFSRNKFKDATKSYRKALELDPNVFESSGNVGTLLQERSVAQRGKYYYFMAKAYAGVGMHERAILYIRKAMEEGFGNIRKVASDDAFLAMHEVPAFQQLVFPISVALVQESTSAR